MQPETRSEARTLVNKPAALVSQSQPVHRGGWQVQECVIGNMSASGALLRFPTTLTLPERVFLVDYSDLSAYAATVMWQRPARCGLKLTAHYELEKLPIDLAFLRPIIMRSA